MWIVTTRVLHGPVTVAAERGGLLIRWLKPNAGSNPAWSSMCLYPNGRGNALRARSVLVRVEPGTPVFADRDDRSRSSRSPAIALRCYASGEAARLSIERDGFESRTARHFRSVAQPGSALRSERRGRWFKSSHSDHFPRAMRRLSRALSARLQHWRAARSYKPGQRTAVDGRDRNPGRRPSTNRRSTCRRILLSC